MGGFFRALILVAVFGATAYLIFGTGLGKRIKENFSLSVLDGCAGNAPLPSAAPSAAPTPEPTAAPTGDTLTVSLPSLSVYFLQMGVFDSMEKAALLSQRIREMGASGYVYDDLGSLRLIAAAYSDEASAESVMTRLKSEGYDCSVYRFSRSGLELLVTASADRLLPIRTAFGLAYDLIEQADELAIDFDASSRSTEYGLGVLSEMRTNISNAAAGVSEMSKRNGMLGVLSSYLSDVSDMISEASAASADRNAFSSALKTLRIKAALRYAGLLSALGE